MSEQTNTDTQETDPDLIRLRNMMEAEDDVLRVMKLAKYGDQGRIRYVIETPFKTFPRFVIGTTDKDFVACRHELKCGQDWGLEKAWGRLMQGLPVHDPADPEVSNEYV